MIRLSWSPDDLIPEAQYVWLQRETARQLARQCPGSALALPNYLFLGDAGDRNRRADVARFLSLVVTQPWGSFEGVGEALAGWARRNGRHPRLHADTARVTVKARKPEFDTLPALEGWADSILRSYWDLTWASVPNRSMMVVQIDENQVPFQGKGSKSYSGAYEFRARATTPAGKGVTALKPGRSYATLVGHEFNTMTATAYPAGVTTALAARFHNPLHYSKGATVKSLLRALRRVQPNPHWIMLDRGYSAYECLAELDQYCKDVASLRPAWPSYFLMPAMKTSARLRTDSCEPLLDEQNALQGVQDVIVDQWNKGPRRVGETALYYATVPRNVKHHDGVTVNLVIFYRIKKSAWKRRPDSLDLERDIAVSPFFTNFTPTDATAPVLNELYSLRWNCENFYQKMVLVLGIIPSKDLWQRVLSFLLGITSMSVYGVQRCREYAQLGEEGRDELTRVMSFFSLARRDLENALDPEAQGSARP